jgi:hypothetical protein
VREAFYTVERQDAVTKYQEATARLLNITHWGVFADEAPETFVLTDALGHVIKRDAGEGDHIKIHLPAPRSSTGDGADWVRIEKIMEERNKMLDEVFTAMTIRPCPNPNLNSKIVAHFYE